MSLGQPNLNLVTSKQESCYTSGQDSNKTNWKGKGIGSKGGRRGNRGGRGRFGKGNNRPTCQVCGKLGHIALNFYFWFDQSYCGSSSNTNIAGNHSSFLVVASLGYPNEDQNWFLDGGASHHISNGPVIEQTSEAK